MEGLKSNPDKINIAVVDDHNLFREGIVALLKDYQDLEVVVQAEDGKQFVKWLDTVKKSAGNLPHIVLLDIQMPEMNGIETTIYLQQFYPDIKIIILTMHNEEELIFDLMNKGASGFLAKDKSVDMVVDAIYSIMENGIYFNEQILHSIVQSWQKTHDIDKLMAELRISPREHEIIQLLAEQKTTKEIAATLTISTRTVDIHRKSIFVKTGTINTAGLVLFAIKNNLLKISKS